MASPTPSSPGGSKVKKQRKSCKGRTLLRWNPGWDQFLVLAIDKVCVDHGIMLPWDAIGKEVRDDVTGEAVKQHLVKLRTARVEAGLKVPDKVDRNVRRKLATNLAPGALNITTQSVPVRKESVVRDQRSETAPATKLDASKWSRLLHNEEGKKTKKTSSKLQGKDQSSKPAQVGADVASSANRVTSNKRNRKLKKTVRDDDESESEADLGSSNKKQCREYSLRVIPAVDYSALGNVGDDEVFEDGREDGVARPQHPPSPQSDTGVKVKQEHDDTVHTNMAHITPRVLPDLPNIQQVLASVEDDGFQEYSASEEANYTFGNSTDVHQDDEDSTPLPSPNLGLDSLKAPMYNHDLGSTPGYGLPSFPFLTHSNDQNMIAMQPALPSVPGHPNETVEEANGGPALEHHQAGFQSSVDTPAVEQTHCDGLNSNGYEVPEDFGVAGGMQHSANGGHFPALQRGGSYHQRLHSDFDLDELQVNTAYGNMMPGSLLGMSASPDDTAHPDHAYGPIAPYASAYAGVGGFYDSDSTVSPGSTMYRGSFSSSFGSHAPSFTQDMLNKHVDVGESSKLFATHSEGMPVGLLNHGDYLPQLAYGDADGLEFGAGFAQG